MINHFDQAPGTLAQRLMKHQTEEPESILTTRPDCPEDLLAIVHTYS